MKSNLTVVALGERAHHLLVQLLSATVSPGVTAVFLPKTMQIQICTTVDLPVEPNHDTPEQHRRHVLKAMRTAIDPLLTLWRQEHLLPDSVCPITGQPLRDDRYTHVHHCRPNDFATLANGWIDSSGGPGQIRVARYAGGRWEMLDEHQRKLWLYYHNKTARLCLLSQQANCNDVLAGQRDKLTGEGIYGYR